MKRKSIKRGISVVLCMCIMLSMIPQVGLANDADFSDVKDYYPFSKWAVETGKKYSLIFLENNTRATRRDEVANIVYNLLDTDSIKRSNIEFNDIEDVDSIKKKSIESVASQGIINGYEDGSFRPFNNVTRAEFVTILDRSNLLKGSPILNNISFNDIETHWGRESILKIASYGIVNGKEDNKFYPNDKVTPQEIFVILDRLVSIDAITEKQLLNAMLNTFKCKEYGEEERFIAEEIYGRFEEVQNELRYSWPYDEYYNTDDWQGLATYEDLQYAMFFNHANYTKISDKDDTQMIYNNVIIASYLMQGLEADNSKYGKNTFLLKNLYRAFESVKGNYYGININAVYYSDESIKLNFKNLNEFSDEDMIAARGMLNDILDEEYFKRNDSVYLPINAPVTKYMLNYYILKLRERDNWKAYTIGSDPNLQIETDPAKVPYNYEEYPYIVKGIPKEVYEMPFGINGKTKRTIIPKDAYINTFYDGTPKIVHSTNNYYNAILNVDYCNTDFDKFREIVYENSCMTDYKEIDAYIQYVKDNEIVLKGKATAVPGSCYTPDLVSNIRIMVEFEIVNSKTDQNLLFGDILNTFGTTIKYPYTKYNLIADIPITGGYDFDKRKLIISSFRPLMSNLCEDAFKGTCVPVMGESNY